MSTGLKEVDRVLGGGFVAGSVTLVYGPPGVGKSTLLFQVLSSVASAGIDVLLASAEESLVQVSGRAGRIGAVPERLLALEGHDVGAIETAIDRHHPGLVVVDSIQSISDDGVPGAAGSLLQVKACVERLTRLAKSTGVPIVLVGHVTKDGDLAGPRAIEHLVDTVLSFDGDRHHAVRLLTAVKHRFGPAGEVGIFEMRDDRTSHRGGSRPVVAGRPAGWHVGVGGGAGAAGSTFASGRGAGFGGPPRLRCSTAGVGSRRCSGVAAYGRLGGPSATSDQRVRRLHCGRGRHHRDRAGSRSGHRAGAGLGCQRPRR